MQLDDSTEVQADQNDSLEADSSLAAGFAKVRGEEPPAAAAAAQDAVTDLDGEASTDATDAPAPGVTQAAAEEAPEEMFAGMKASEVKALLAKAAQFDELKSQVEANNQKMYGKLGEYQRKINELSSKPAGQQIAFSKDALKKLGGEFPELAELLAEDLSALSLNSAASSADPEQVEKIVAERVEQIRVENEKKLLTLAHRDWRDAIKSDEWKIWRATLPAEAQQVLDTSQDAMQIADAITDFKGWKQTNVAQAEAASRRRANRLEKSVMPAGVPASGPARLPDSAGLNAGFSRVRRGA